LLSRDAFPANSSTWGKQIETERQISTRKRKFLRRIKNSVQPTSLQPRQSSTLSIFKKLTSSFTQQATNRTPSPFFPRLIRTRFCIPTKIRVHLIRRPFEGRISLSPSSALTLNSLLFIYW
jgi:hypothetical protein